MDPIKIGWPGSAEHGMVRGDWLLHGRGRDGTLEFEGLSDPTLEDGRR